MSIFRSSDGIKFQSEIHMRKYQMELDLMVELESIYLGLTLERTGARILSQARELARTGQSWEFPDGLVFSWSAGRVLPRGHIQHDPIRVEQLRVKLLRLDTVRAAKPLWQRVCRINNHGREWDGLPGTTVCFEQRL